MVHTGFAPFEFIVDLNHRPRSRLLLPDSFATATEDIRPSGFWLQVDGCPNGPSWALAERTAEGALLLGQGWKSFSRAHRLSRGQCLAFRFDGDATLSVKIFGVDGGRVECCAESSSGSSSSYDEDDDEENSSSIKVEGSSSS